mmetsp:Transcript_1430/g.2777  ORF Transcript_1430/g.2777 Transcript_1430/m.2777 type:complete len:398 (+) Transcript_1430:112-1305(+)
MAPSKRLTVVINVMAVFCFLMMWRRVRGLLDVISMDHTESRWIDRLIFHEAGTFSDLQQSVGKHQTLLQSISLHNRRLAQAVDEEASDMVLAGGAGAEVVLARAGEAVADGEGDFGELWLEEIKRAVAASHNDYAKAVESNGGRDLKAASARFGGDEEGKHMCLGAAGVESALGEHLGLVKATGMTDFASAELGGEVVFANRLTSPSHPTDDGSALSGTMRHVLGLRTRFPPPAFVLAKQPSLGGGAALVAGGDGSQTGSSGGSGGGGLLTGQCWAFPGTVGKLTVALARAVVVTHLTLEQRPPYAASAGEASAAPKEVKVWALKTPTDQSPRLLANFTFDQRRGQAKQTFKVHSNTNAVEPATLVTLDVRSNHGNPDFTCIHKFRVHSVDATSTGE